MRFSRLCSSPPQLWGPISPLYDIVQWVARLFPGVKAAGAWRCHPPHRSSRLRMNKAITLLSFYAGIGCYGATFTFTFIVMIFFLRFVRRCRSHVVLLKFCHIFKSFINSSVIVFFGVLWCWDVSANFVCCFKLSDLHNAPGLYGLMFQQRAAFICYDTRVCCSLCYVLSD